MNKLTPMFIAGALAISAGLMIAQNEMNTDDMPDHDMSDHNMPGHSMPADNPSEESPGRTQ